ASSSSTTSSRTRSTPEPKSAGSVSRATACGTVRGNPSSWNPSLASPSPSRPATMLMVTSSGTSWPASMYRLASTPSGVPWATFARKMSPVEILGTARCAAMNSAWVPLPAPGGPTSTSLTRAPRCAAPLRPLAEEPFVVALHQLALDLFDGFQTDADDDQYRGTAEGEVLPVAADHV